jgi:hypothetical protein
VIKQTDPGYSIPVVLLFGASAANSLVRVGLRAATQVADVLSCRDPCGKRPLVTVPEGAFTSIGHVECASPRVR